MVRVSTLNNGYLACSDGKSTLSDGHQGSEHSSRPLATRYLRGIQIRVTTFLICNGYR